MNPANDQRFQELAMKLVGRECTADEIAELRRMVEEEPGRREQLQKLCDSVGIARELLPLVSALDATEGEMTGLELETFRKEVARVRKQGRNPIGTPPSNAGPSSRRGDAGGGGARDTVIDAEVVPDKPRNIYKILFFAVLLVMFVIGCVVLLKSCGAPKAAAGVDGKPPNAPAPAAVGEPVRTPPEMATGSAERQSAPQRAADPGAGAANVSGQSVKTTLPSYLGARWVKVFDSNSKPGFRLSFRQFALPASAYPVVEGLIAPNEQIPTGLMLLRGAASGWEPQSFPGVPSEPDFIGSLDEKRVVMSCDSANTAVFLIEGSQARKLANLGWSKCVAVHEVAANRFMLHCYEGNAFEVNGQEVTPLRETDAATYIHEDGRPTAMPRGGIHSIAKADTGDTMGIYWRRPTSIGPAAVVRFDGKVWELVCHLGKNYLGSRTHFLTSTSLVAALDDEVVVVKGGNLITMGAPAEFEALRTAKFMAVRAASAEDFVLVDSYGGVYRYANGKYQQPVGPLASLRGTAGTYPFRSVMIAPDGVIYAIHGLDKWTTGTIYQLAPN